MEKVESRSVLSIQNLLWNEITKELNNGSVTAMLIKYIS
jgi:hypothetical protein